jgi:hypothetical protein
MKPNLQALVAYWQKALRLLDWRIQAEYVRDLCASEGSPVYGLCSRLVDNKTAYLRIRDPETPIPDGRDPNVTVERTVIHECAHLHFAAFGTCSPAEIAVEEQAVWAFADALFAHKGTGREEYLARAMRSEISALAERRRMGGNMMSKETVQAALEALKGGNGDAAIEVLTQILSEGMGAGGESPPPDNGGDAPPAQAAPVQEPPRQAAPLASGAPRAARPALAPRPAPQGLVQGAAIDGEAVRRMVVEGVTAGLDGFRRDELLETQGHVLSEDDLRWARSQPFETVRRMVGAAAGPQPQEPRGRSSAPAPRAARPSAPTRGNGAASGGADPTGGHIDRLMRVAKDEQPAVMIDPSTNRMFVSNLKPVTVGVLGAEKGR